MPAHFYTPINKRFSRLCCTLLLLFTSLTAFAQIEDVLEKLNLYSLAYPQEKVFLHMDRTTYGNGETIHFQAYVTISPLGIFTDLSNTLFVQLIDAQGQVITQDKIFVENGAGEGHIDIPDSLMNGQYQVAAFTNWMQNFGQENFFRKNIEVLSSATEVNILAAQSTTIDLQFLPESGALTAEIPSKIAFKAINSQSKPVAVKGQIFNQNDQAVASFETSHDGMGTVFLTPSPNSSYYAKIDLNESQYNLPSVSHTGAQIKVNYLNEKVKVSIVQKGFEKSTGNFHLLIHNKGFISSALQMPAQRNLSIINLPFDKLDRGINSLTLLNADLVPIAERLIFINKDKEVLTAKIGDKQISTRGKATLDLNLDLPDTVGAILSLSAVDISQTFEQKNTDNIISELLLSTELNGKIYKPAFYFEKGANIELIDLLMLTHGWRNFDFNKIAKGDFPQIDFSPEKGVTISGKAYKPGKKEKVAKNAELTLIRQDNELPVFLSAKTDSKGYFEFREAIIFEDDSLIIRGSREKNGSSKLRIAFDSTKTVFPNTFFKRLDEHPSTQEREEIFISKKEERKQIDEAYGFLLDSTATLLDDIVVEGYKTEARPDSVLLETSIGRGDAAQDFNDPMYNGSYNTVFNALQGKIPGVQISGGQVSIRQAGRINASEPLYLLNDVPVDRTTIETLTVQQIDRVVVFKSLAKTVVYGQQAAGGIMAFYLKKGSGGLAPKDRTKVSIAQFLSGYQAQTQFYSPKYDEVLPEHIIPDRRVLVHWQPMISLTGKSQKTIEFWSSDLAGTIAIELQGLTTNGQPVYFYKTIEVKAAEN